MSTVELEVPVDAVVDDVEQTREQLRDRARVMMGVTGDTEAPQFRSTLRKHGVGWYPLVALGVLSIVDTFQSYAFTVLTPEISRALGIGKGGIAAARAVALLAIAVAPLPLAALVEKKPRRALLAVAAGIGWSLVAISTGYVVLLWGLLFVLVLDGLTTATTGVLHQPLLMDSYPPDGRVRAMSYYTGANQFGNVLAPLAVAALSTAAGLTWRGVFVVLGLTSLVAAISCFRLRDPGFGTWDTKKIRKAVHEFHGENEQQSAAAVEAEDVRLGFFEIVRRLLLIPSAKRVLSGFLVFGILSVPYTTFLSFFLEERWSLGPGGRGLFTAAQAAVAMLALFAYGKQGEAMFRESPARVVRLASLMLAVAVVVIFCAGLVPWFPVMVTLFLVAAALIAMLSPAFAITLLGIIPAEMRPHAAALQFFFFGAGGLLGAMFLSGIDRRFGVAAALTSMMIPGVVGALILASAGKLVPRDLDRMIDEVLEDEEIRRLTNSGAHLPMLACRGIDFSYGQLQVLFDVNFTVDDGEMVALLGVNGAGKSTLLKVISGIGLPSAGTVRFRGADITYLDAERRLRFGLTQIPGGRAVFGPMTVVENLRGFGYTVSRDKKGLDEAIDRCFDTFPRLAERRNQLASTLSGGEQQMLGLSKALILEPRLLLIDELSLGLAPVVVGQLLEMVRAINQGGTAVVLVEQSVNIALNLVDHAYFMEKGEIRFDGRSEDLLARDDLLRAVFLEGAGQGSKL